MAGDCLRVGLRGLRWGIIIACFAFVVYGKYHKNAVSPNSVQLLVCYSGWYSSVTKFLQNAYSLSIELKENDRFRYPSVTFCPEFRQREGQRRAIDISGDILHWDVNVVKGQCHTGNRLSQQY